MDISGIASVIGALGIGSFAGQYLIGAQQRRQFRSEVLRQLAHTESSRWANEQQVPPFLESIRELETAALIARVPEKVVVHYKIFATTAWWLSRASWEEDSDEEYGGGIDGHFADLVRGAANELSRSVWSPWTSRVGRAGRLKTRRGLAEQISGASSYLARAVERAGA